MEWIFVVILTVSIIHVIEEYNGGFVDQMKQFVPGTDLSQFVSINMTFIVMCFIAVIVGSSNLVYSLSIAALLFINVLFHVEGSIRLRGYNAGLVTAVVLYLPVSIYAYYYFWNSGSLTPLEFILSILLGAFWMVIVLVHQFIQIKIKGKQLTD
jgi:Protein of unknown function with HXXEE motif